MKLVQPIAEEIVEYLAKNAGPNSAAAQVLAEAAEIKARGNQVRFWITNQPGLCVEEGVAFISTSEQ